MLTWPLTLALLLAAFGLHLYIVAPDLRAAQPGAPPPHDPYAAERRRNGESPDPDRETAPDPRFPGDLPGSDSPR